MNIKKIILLTGALVVFPSCAAMAPVLEAVAPRAEVGAAGQGVKLDFAKLVSAVCVNADSPLVTSLKEKVPFGVGDLVVSLTLPICSEETS